LNCYKAISVSVLFTVTVQELEYYVGKWIQRKYSKFRILYLALHGEKNNILLGNKKNYSIDDLAKLLTHVMHR
jgi:hypothetical protein